MKIRVVIEYDPDWVVRSTIEKALEAERRDWIEGNVSVDDVLQCGGTIKVEVIK